MCDKDRQECVKVIASFLDGSCGDYDWDDFISIKSSDSLVQLVKDYCADSDFLYPPDKTGQWCNEQGAQKLEELVQLLKNGEASIIESFIETEMRNTEHRG